MTLLKDFLHIKVLITSAAIMITISHLGDALGSALGRPTITSTSFRNSSCDWYEEVQQALAVSFEYNQKQQLKTEFVNKKTSLPKDNEDIDFIRATELSLKEVTNRRAIGGQQESDDDMLEEAIKRSLSCSRPVVFDVEAIDKSLQDAMILSMQHHNTLSSLNKGSKHVNNTLKGNEWDDNDAELLLAIELSKSSSSNSNPSINQNRFNSAATVGQQSNPTTTSVGGSGMGRSDMGDLLEQLRTISPRDVPPTSSVASTTIHNDIGRTEFVNSRTGNLKSIENEEEEELQLALLLSMDEVAFK